MPHLLYSARDAEGKPVEGFVEAPDVARARQQLLSQGLADVVLHQETNLATDAKELAGLRPEQLQQIARIRIRAMNRAGLAPLLGEVARSNRGWLAVDVAMFAWGAWTSSALLLFSGAGLALVPFALAAWHYRHGDRYNQLVKAHAVGDWERVKALAAKLRSVSGKVGQLDFDLDIRLACIEARQGRLAPALASIEPWRARLAAKPGLFEGRLASVHSAGEDRAGYVRLMAAAHEHAPNEPSRTLDLALAQARFGDMASAGELMQALDTTLLPPHAKAFVAWVEGLVRLRAQQPGALEHLGDAVTGFLQLSGNQPAAWTSLAFCTCDHAVALSMAGRKDESRRELAEVWPILKAHGDKSLLRMLEADGLAPPSDS